MSNLIHSKHNSINWPLYTIMYILFADVMFALIRGTLTLVQCPCRNEAFI